MTEPARYIGGVGTLAAQEDARRGNKSASEQAAALNYHRFWEASTIGPASSPTLESPSIEKKPVVQEPQKSWFGKAKDWLSSLFSGKSKDNTSVEADKEQQGSGSLQVSEKSTADNEDAQRIGKQLTKTNRELVYRLKEMVEFEEEITKTLGTPIDKIIFLELINSSLRQKEIKEESSFIINKFVLDLHGKNKTLRNAHFHLVDEINRHEKVDKVLTWVNVGLTVGILGALAITYATGGVAAIAIGGAGKALMYFGKGGATLTQGILSYKNSLKTGELFVINQDTKLNSRQINDELGILRLNDEEVGRLLKLIREHLDNQSQAERADAGNKS